MLKIHNTYPFCWCYAYPYPSIVLLTLEVCVISLMVVPGWQHSTLNRKNMMFSLFSFFSLGFSWGYFNIYFIYSFYTSGYFQLTCKLHLILPWKYFLCVLNDMFVFCFLPLKNLVHLQICISLVDHFRAVHRCQLSLTITQCKNHSIITEE